ncbi:uncharacterized protein [Bemisia tabaci]|uniref:uncharacterized protein n=1 Tax=Bemisia tabaci TaxID=7038 RepID=UPI003B28C6B1
MGALTDDVKRAVFVKLNEVFRDDVETLARVLYYLDQEEDAYRHAERVPPFWRTLVNALVSDALFATYARRLAQDTRGEQENEDFMRYIRRLGQIYDRHLTASEREADISDVQSLDVRLLADIELGQRDGAVGFARTWAFMTPESQAEVLKFARSLCADTRVAVWGNLDDVVGVLSKVRGNVVLVGLAIATIAYDVLRNIRRWWHGEISGKRCCKNIVDSVLSLVGGLGGGLAGTVMGTVVAGPVGALVGGAAGAIVAGRVTNMLSDRLTQWIFGLPRTEALENAFNFFRLPATASNHEINTAYRQLCLKHHPDKGGNAEEFHVVQVNMAVIAASRDEI